MGAEQGGDRDVLVYGRPVHALAPPDQAPLGALGRRGHPKARELSQRGRQLPPLRQNKV